MEGGGELCFRGRVNLGQFRPGSPGRFDHQPIWCRALHSRLDAGRGQLDRRAGSHHGFGQFQRGNRRS